MKIIIVHIESNKKHLRVEWNVLSLKRQQMMKSHWIALQIEYDMNSEMNNEKKIK